MIADLEPDRLLDATVDGKNHAPALAAAAPSKSEVEPAPVLLASSPMSSKLVVTFAGPCMGMHADEKTRNHVMFAAWLAKYAILALLLLCALPMYAMF